MKSTTKSVYARVALTIGQLSGRLRHLSCIDSSFIKRPRLRWDLPDEPLGEVVVSFCQSSRTFDGVLMSCLSVSAATSLPLAIVECLAIVELKIVALQLGRDLALGDQIRTDPGRWNAAYSSFAWASQASV